MQRITVFKHEKCRKKLEFKKKKLKLKSISNFKAILSCPIVCLEHRIPSMAQKEKDWGQIMEGIECPSDCFPQIKAKQSNETPVRLELCLYLNT